MKEHQLTQPHQQGVNPDFGLVAGLIKEGAAILKAAGNLAQEKLYRPELSLRKVTELLEGMAKDIEDGLVWKAYVRHFLITDAPVRPPHALKSRAAKLRSPHTADNVRIFGRKGGLSKSPAKREAAQENGKLGGRPKRRGGSHLPSHTPESAISDRNVGGLKCGKVTSERKAMAARLNGRKGGRPKKGTRSSEASLEASPLPSAEVKTQPAKNRRLLVGKVNPSQISFTEV